MAHSGFQNAKQEHYYNKLVQKLVQMLQSRVLKFYNNGKLPGLNLMTFFIYRIWEWCSVPLQAAKAEQSDGAMREVQQVRWVILIAF